MSDKRFCNENCNECPLMIYNDSNRQLSMILNLINDKFGKEAYNIIQDNCPNLTCCSDCRIDDFCHIESCEICEKIDSEKENDGTNN